MNPEFAPAHLGTAFTADQFEEFFKGEDGPAFWELTLLAGQLEMMVAQAISRSEEPAVVAKYSFRLAQGFNNFYHHFHILNETPTPAPTLPPLPRST